MRQSPKSVVAMKRPPKALPRRLHGLMHRQDLRSRLVPVHDLASALAGATYLARPDLPLRCLLPPTLTYYQGGGARTTASEALALVEECLQHKAAMRAALSAVSSLAGRQPRHEVVSPNFFDALIGRIQATCELLAGPLDVILADIEHEYIQCAAWAKESVALMLAEEHSRHEAAALLAVADKHRRHEVAARNAESEALALTEGRRCHKDATRASLSAVSPLADKRSRHEGAD